MTINTVPLEQEILIIESDRPTLDLYRRELAREYRVTPCSDERELLDILSDRPIAALVVEPARRSLQDSDWLASITEACHASSVPIVVCTTLDPRRRHLDLGVDAYLVKPTLPATLLATLKRVVRQA